MNVNLRWDFAPDDQQRFGDATAAVLDDPAVDAALTILTPQAMTDPAGSAAQVQAAASGSRKPVLAAWMGGAAVREARGSFEGAGIPAYTTPGHAVRAFMHLVSYARNLEILYETPRTIPVSFELDRSRTHDLLEAILRQLGYVTGLSSTAERHIGDLTVTPACERCGVAGAVDVRGVVLGGEVQ